MSDHTYQGTVSRCFPSSMIEIRLVFSGEQFGVSIKDVTSSHTLIQGVHLLNLSKEITELLTKILQKELILVVFFASVQ